MGGAQHRPPTLWLMEDSLWTFQWPCKVTQGASQERPASYQPSLEAVSDYASLQTPHPGLPGDLAKPLPRETRCPLHVLAASPLFSSRYLAPRAWRLEASHHCCSVGTGLSHQPAPVPRQREQWGLSREERAAGPLWPHLFLKSPQ